MKRWWLMLLIPTAALAKTENWPGRYNTGVTAYRSNDFTAAASAFEQATASQDKALQHHAYYNLGNTAYRLSEAQPQQAQQLWQRALKDYETALALDSKDEDAKFNRNFVKKKIEELKKQQEQQQQNQKDQNQKDQDKQDNQQKKEQDQQQESQQSQQQQQEQEQQKGKPQDQQQAQTQPDNLDKQQAKALLDNMREDERNWNFFPEVQMKDLKDSGEPVKDW